jgi:D-alanyl-D-alanine carboxypeptidase/D-alanyl-D-alanine-endopeptidase (penicillin-binding protein 4)
MRIIGTLAACIAAALVCAPAWAVDRTIGAAVPKPAASGAPWTDLQISALSANLDLALSGAATLRGAHVGVYAIDAHDGRVLFERAQDDLFQPASTLKLVTGSAALDILGEQQRFHTELLLDRSTDGGGDVLVLRGGGDPFLTKADFAAAADAYAATKPAVVHRQLLIDDRRYAPASYAPGWTWDDFAYGYAPLVSALPFSENTVHLTVTPAATEGKRAVVAADPIGVVGTFVEGCGFGSQLHIVPLAVTTAAGAENTVDVVRERNGCLDVVGTIGLGTAPTTIDAAVPVPTRFAHDALEREFARNGEAAHVEVSSGPDDYAGGLAATRPATVVWSHDSEPLSDTLADMWLPSDNLIAEVLLHELALAPPAPGTLPTVGPATFAGGVARETRWLNALGIDASQFALSDGSGMSQYDRITPRALATVLRHDWDGAHRDLVLDDLPISGVRGTLADGFDTSDAAKRVFAKTGSLSRANAIAGYVATTTHGTAIVVFMVDDWAGAHADFSAVRNRVLATLADQ